MNELKKQLENLQKELETKKEEIIELELKIEVTKEYIKKEELRKLIRLLNESGIIQTNEEYQIYLEIDRLLNELEV